MGATPFVWWGEPLHTPLPVYGATSQWHQVGKISSQTKGAEFGQAQA